MSYAEEMYGYYRQKRDTAASVKSTAESRQNEYTAQKKQAERERKDSNSTKINLEKRLEGVRKILGMMNGSGGFFSENVPERIVDAVRKAADAGTDFNGCIRCTGITAANLGEKFTSENVGSNTHTANALAAFRAEETRLVNLIEEIKRQISRLDSQIEVLKSNISSCSQTISQAKSTVRNSESWMSYYRNLM